MVSLQVNDLNLLILVILDIVKEVKNQVLWVRLDLPRDTIPLPARYLLHKIQLLRFRSPSAHAAFARQELGFLQRGIVLRAPEGPRKIGIQSYRTSGGDVFDTLM